MYIFYLIRIIKYLNFFNNTILLLYKKVNTINNKIL